jgi:hypothetical protein
MDIVIFGIIAVVLFVMAALNKQHKLVGMVGGIGLIMLALFVQIVNLQMQTGVNQTVYTEINSSTLTYLYSNISDISTGFTELQVALVIILGAAGIFVLINSIRSVKL